MPRGVWIAVFIALCTAAGVTALALVAAARDRSALVAGFSDEHLSRVRFAAKEVESELADVARDLEFAGHLVAAADTASDRERELRALLAVVRAYRMVVVQDEAGRPVLTVVDPLAPLPWSAAPFEAPFADTARRAARSGALAVSPLVEGPHSPWYRVFAMPLPDGQRGVVAILVDLQDAFDRLRVLAPAPSSGLLVLRPDGQPAPATSPVLAAQVTAARPLPGVAALVSALRSGAAGKASLGTAEARALGLPAADAIAAYAPIRDGASGAWAVAVLDSTVLLESKERAITLQLASLGALVALALALLAGYLVLSARRVLAVQERLRSADQIARAEKLATVGVLAAGIAHEIGTPLGVVRGRAERIAEKLGAGHALTEGARTIVAEIDRISRTLRELLDYSRRAQAATVPVALEEVARRVVGLLALEAEARQVALEVELVEPLPRLAADPDQLQQVLVNLVLNALHASAPGSRVAIRGRPGPPGRVRVEVEDAGTGIPDELRHRVFDPFFTTKKRGKGTGLGLTVAAQLVANHGGELDLVSEVGRGTTVRILWPLAGGGT